MYYFEAHLHVCLEFCFLNKGQETLKYHFKARNKDF